MTSTRTYATRAILSAIVLAGCRGQVAIGDEGDGGPGADPGVSMRPAAPPANGSAEASVAAVPPAPDVTADAMPVIPPGFDAGCLKPTGTPVVLATAPAVPWGLAVDATSVYWATQIGGPVMKVPITGGPAVTLDEQSRYELAIDDRAAYSVRNGNVVACAKGGCNGSPTTIATTSAQSPFGIAVDGANVYWATTGQGTVMKAPIGGGAATILAQSNYPYQIAVDADSVYWTDQGSPSSIVKIAKTGGSPTTLVTSLQSAVAIAVDSRNVYYTSNVGNLGTVVQLSTSGGAPLVLSTNAGSEPVGIAVDATSVYWVNQEASTVMRVNIGGDCEMTLATGQSSPAGIAVDSSNVYWTDADSSRVMKLAKY